MVPNHVKIVVIVDNDLSSRTINLSLLRSLSIVQEVVECDNSREVFSCIEKYNLKYSTPDILLINLKRQSSMERNFLDFYKAMTKPQEILYRFIVLSTPDFFEDMFKLGVPNFNLPDKQVVTETNSVQGGFEEAIMPVPGLKDKDESSSLVDSSI